MNGSSKLVQSLRSLELELPPSCVEFCPAFPSFFLVGTYSLQAGGSDSNNENTENTGPEEEDDQDIPQSRQPQSRNGSIVAFRFLDGAITHIQTMPQPSALLDLRFNPHHGNDDVCAVVSSTATIALFRLTPDDSQGPLKHLRTMDMATMSQGEINPSPGSEILFTSFGWHPLRADTMAVTTSTGQVYIVRLPSFDGDWSLDPEPLITHSLEAWCVVIAPFPALSETDETRETDGIVCRVYSGGDDSVLRYRTCTWNADSIAAPLPAVQSKGHDAGVTAILPLFEDKDGNGLVVTGSYDEHIRLFSVPRLGKAMNLSESCLGGGVWRLKLIDMERTPSRDYYWRVRILASCMHAGTRVVELFETNEGEYRIQVLARFEEHKSMNYGSDFLPGWKEKLSVVSTSFYDKLLCLWELDMD
ncbi:hypothetical protein VTK26DRAFT_7293 [Humicola hyalothermophila]